MDETAQIVVAAELSNIAVDSDRLPVRLAAVKANLCQDADQVLADAGYRSEAVFEQLKDSPSELIVALGREGKQGHWRSMPHSTRAMQPCRRSSRCHKRRRLTARESGSWRPPNGWIKSVLGFSQFSLRGLQEVQAEFKLVCLALNLRRMCRLRAV